MIRVNVFFVCCTAAGGHGNWRIAKNTGLPAVIRHVVIVYALWTAHRSVAWMAGVIADRRQLVVVVAWIQAVNGGRRVWRMVAGTRRRSTGQQNMVRYSCSVLRF